MKPDDIKQALLTDDSDAVARRKKVLVMSAIGLVDFSIISLYQTGIIKHMPDLPFAIFDSDKVNRASKAYALGAPDGPLGAAAYAACMVLAVAGGTEKSGRKPAWDVALGGVVAGNAVGAISYLYDMIFKEKKICLYCVAGAALNFASAIIIAPAVLKSLRKLF